MSRRGRSLLAEFLGTALLLFVIVGSGITVERISQDGGVQLLAHAVAVGAGLCMLIALLAPVSGAHFNPVVTAAARLTGGMASSSDALTYMATQVVGGLVGVIIASATFGEPLVTIASTERSGLGVAVAESIATFVLILLILGLVRTDRAAFVPAAVGAWVTTIILATSSTGFANPAVTLARMFTDTFSGIAPGSAPAFLAAELVGGLVAAVAAVALFPTTTIVRATHTTPLEEAA